MEFTKIEENMNAEDAELLHIFYSLDENSFPNKRYNLNNNSFIKTELTKLV
jgi:hypothetical protein